MGKRWHACGAWGLLAWLAQGSIANAETDQAADILVTATKRAEPARAVPMALWVASPERLDRARVRDFDDLVTIDPALTIAKTTNPGNNSIAIRGIGTYAFSIATRPSVAVVVDEVPMAFQAQAFGELTDIASIAVLRGPQSTLFGPSATAGVIAITTAAPAAQPGWVLRLGTTSDGEHRASGTVTGPVAPGLRFRLSASVHDFEGNLRNVVTGHWIDGQADASARLRLDWTPTPDLSIAFSAHVVHSASTCCATAFVAVSPGVTFGRFGGYQAPRAAILNGITPAPGNRQTSIDVEPQGESQDRGASVKLDWQFGRYRLTSISALTTYRLDDLQDTDGTAFNWGPGGAQVAGALAGGSANGGFSRFTSVLQDLRLTSPDAGRVRLVAGLVYTHLSASRDFVRGTNALGRDGTLSSVPPTTSSWSSYAAQAFDTNWALYANATVSLVPQVELTLGGRLNHDTMRYRLDDRVNGVAFGSPACSSATPSGLLASTCNRFDAATGRAGLTYWPWRGVMLFAGYDRGYKGAAYDLTSTYTMRSPVTAPGPFQGKPVADAVAAKQPVRPEMVDAFQAGIKATLGDRLRADLTLYREVFHGFQAQSRDELTRQNILNSIGQVTLSGIEADLSGRPLANLSIDLSGAWNKARIDDFPNAACYPGQTAALGCIDGQQALSGASLPHAPRWKFTLGARQAARLTHAVQMTLIANWRWQSAVMQSLLQDPDARQEAYGVLDLGIDLVRSRTRIGLYARNLLDRGHALNRGRDGNWNINPYGALAGPVSDAIKWTPARDTARFFGAELTLSY